MPSATRNRRARLDRRSRSARAEGRDARAELLEAALAVFAERGYRDASVDEIAERAGYSKGAVYWHFTSKDDLFFALWDERVDRPWSETIKLLESAAADHDMAPEASRRFAEVMQGQRELLLIDHEYWGQVVRDPKRRARYAKRRERMRTALGKAIAARMEHLGAPPLEGPPEHMAALFIAVITGLAREKLIDPEAAPDHLVGEAFALFYAGHVARTHGHDAKTP
jgi:AcrR family transcriptional regulator